jgi:hypothetical protein
VLVISSLPMFMLSFFLRDLKGVFKEIDNYKLISTKEKVSSCNTKEKYIFLSMFLIFFPYFSALLEDKIYFLPIFLILFPYFSALLVNML